MQHFLFFIILLNLNAKGLTYKKAIKIHVIEPCNDHPKNAIMDIKNVQLKDTPRGTHIYFEANVTANWPKGMEFIMNAKRCKNKENLDACETWSPISTTNPCGLIYLKGQPWSKLTEDIRPPFICPMIKNYYIINGSLEFDNQPFLLPVPIDNHIWRAEFRLLVKKQVRCSMCWMVQVIRNNRN